MVREERDGAAKAYVGNGAEGGLADTNVAFPL